MNNVALNNTLRFIGLLLLQVLVLNHINLFGFINPLLYIVWVLLYPIKKNKTTLLLLSFLLGLSIDFFSDSGGIHAAATLFIAYIRIPVLNTILGKSDFDYLLFNLRSIAFIKAFTFIALLTFIHHFIIFSLEYFSFNSISSILYNTLLTGVFTIILSVLGIILFTKKK
ncbi:rod shape-determining protein MreD [Lutibacter sp.]|jgi:rod shape-determining protein MreD|uniref:rod shape-determining protein MreD n=1 Tax=Lutibacter sp. TaxID=1925666 RepID=UPI001A3489A3|nr:rod shape-determining protein MreD [Lutibacter sp.]MBI9041911.1 rod shape-determining protein MreD [Lutibacter sp.]